MFFIGSDNDEQSNRGALWQLLWTPATDTLAMKQHM